MAPRPRAPRKLNLGCGPHAKPGWVNLDAAKLPGVNVVWDIERFPWPFADDSFDEVDATFILEHVADFLKTMEELHRVCAPGARLVIRVPHATNPFFWNDPTHVRPFNWGSFDYLTPQTPFPYLTKARFSIERRKIFYLQAASLWRSRWFIAPLDWLLNVMPPMYEKLASGLLPISELHIALRAIKTPKRS